MSLADVVADRTPPPVRVGTAEVVSSSPLTVSRGAGPESATSVLPGHTHYPGDRVCVVEAPGRLWVIGTLADRPALATVLSVSGGLATVTTATGQLRVAIPSGLSVSTGAVVALVWRPTGPAAVGTLTGAPASLGVPTTPATDDDMATTLPGATTGVAEASPVQVCTARSGAWRTDRVEAQTSAYQGPYGAYGTNTGYFFYGAGALRVPGATAATGATITLSRDRVAGIFAPQAVRLYLHGSSTRPATPPALVGSASTIGTLAAGASGPLPLPGAYAQALLDGSASGLAVYSASQTDYMILRGGAVRIPYTIS